MSLFAQSLIILFIVAGMVAIFYVLKKMREEKEKLKWLSLKKYQLLHILVPKNNDKDPVSAEQMFASLHGIFRAEEKWQEQISFEIISRERFIHFYVYVPFELKDFIEGQIYAQYPSVEINEVEDYAMEKPPDKYFAGAELILNKEYVYPIKTFISFKVDPLAAITSVLAKTSGKEEIWIQLIVRPVSDTWQDKGIAYVESIRSGIPLGGNIWGQVFKGLIGFVSDIFKTAANRPVEVGETAEVKLSGPQEVALKGIEEKITKLGFVTKIRILSFADSYSAARAKVNVVAGAFKQFNMINLNGFEVGEIKSTRDFYESYKKRSLIDDGYVLNIEELASVFHLPNTTVETPNIVWAGSKKSEPPSNLPIEGKSSKEEMVIFAKTDYRHEVQRFGIKNVDRRLHIYAMGKTGTGKSTMLENMIENDIKNEKGVAVVDPHGDLINHILDFIPTSRINDVVYFNPADNDWPIGFNPLEAVDPELKNIVASGVVGIFKKIFGTSWGPRLEYILRNAILALLEYPESTLLGVMKILVDKEFRKKVIDKVTDPVVKDFFVNEYNQWDQKFRLEAIQSIQNKVGQFLSSSNIRNIVGQPHSTFDIRKIMDDGKILLIDLSIGKIGEDNASLLGALLITKIQLAAMQRVDLPESQRRDFYLYVDEFQNFATESFAVILSEARKYHLNLVMTHQYIAQMLESVAKAVFGNVGSIISFRVGSGDAAILAKEFEPVFEANDLVNLDNYHIYIKMAIDGVTRPAFSAITLPPCLEKNNNREKIIQMSRERYANPRAFVEEKIKKWSEESRSIIEKVGIQKKQAVEQIIKEEKSNKYPKGDYIYAQFFDKNNMVWYLPLEKITPKEEEKKISTLKIDKERIAKDLKPILKPILERKKTKQEIKKEIDHLITTHEIQEIMKSKNEHVKDLKAGETIKIE